MVRTRTLHRYFCVVGPRPKGQPPPQLTRHSYAYAFGRGPGLPGSTYWPGISYYYLCAFREEGLCVRAMSVSGGVWLQAGNPDYDHWREVRDVFATPVRASDRIVNIVCAPLGLPLGAPRSGRDMKRGAIADGIGPAEKLYRPATALAGLYTEGVRNIAITGMQRGQYPHEGETDVLAEYDIVCAPRPCDERELQRLNVRCGYWAPEFFAKLLKSMEDDPMSAQDGTA